MQLIPILSSPTLRIFFDSDICRLSAREDGELKLRIKLPEDYPANHLILLLKLKHKERYVGPTMMLFIKIINRKASLDCEKSAFDIDEVEELQENPGKDAMKQHLELIRKGVDVYSEQQILNMGSMLTDEGYGTFDRCANVLRTLRGDIDKARKLLTRITFTEA